MNIDEPRLPMWLPAARCSWRPRDGRRVVDTENGMVFERRCAFSEGHEGGHRIGWLDVTDEAANVPTGNYL